MLCPCAWVFRSTEYHALLYSMQQLFRKVESTKPVASRGTSAEIYVVCIGYLAPAKIDNRLLDARHLFADTAGPIQPQDVLAGGSVISLYSRSLSPEVLTRWALSHSHPFRTGPSARLPACIEGRCYTMHATPPHLETVSACLRVSPACEDPNPTGSLRLLKNNADLGRGGCDPVRWRRRSRSATAAGTRTA